MTPELRTAIENQIQNSPSGARFNSHEFILTLAQANQRAYINSLSETQGEDPFRRLHVAISRVLGGSPLLRPDDPDKQPSRNIFGSEEYDVAAWVRI